MADRIIVLDAETSEVKLDVTNDTHSIIDNEARQRQLQGLRDHNDNERIRQTRGKNFVNCFDKRVKELSTDAKGNDLGALFFLLQYMQLNKDELLIRKGKPASVNDIAEMLGKSKRTTIDILDRLVQMGAIIKGGTNSRNTTYSISPKIAVMGTFDTGKEGLGLYSRIYQVYTRAKLKEITLEDADVLMRIIPHFHHEKYYLCSNPWEDEEAVAPLNETELAQLININRRTLNRRLGNLVKAGFLLPLKHDNASTYKIHPDVMTREKSVSSAYAKVLREDFRVYRAVLDKAE
ncbi:hypothetical protein SAMN04487895_10685 [Paenibacillus sophorae]|uniref:HTH domain-containing protein n=1 Tax=Paenibacillus sophorae TaxID=1333845 RepID=A0A1H8N6S4_9BACL|nr:hypothetical protein [Paenibacillus sophorae]QWU14757.1 hypothetical protein KP014_22965 [Paenibacillus sophorae]SEO25280.1 hypothetical protein SAMN04487895_10685 [Paenibacillus sophorae]